MPEWLNQDVTHLVSCVQEGKVSARLLVEQALARADTARPLNAYLSLDEEAALQTAQHIDERQRRGEALGKLAGLPISIKDALCTRDAPTTAASKILTRDGATHATGFRPAYDATVVERLRAADAIVFGKTNMDEFAMGSSTENSAFGPTKNPWDPTRIPGGSSGGSAVSVAARIVPAALGSDTGGSIRQPASLCGVVGVKPSYGRVSRYGLIAFASSLDQVGPFATTVRGAARVLEVIAGPDASDSTCSPEAVPDYEAACARDVSGLRVGVPREYFAEGLEPHVRESIESTIEGLRRAGCEVRDVSLPHTRYGISTYYLVATAEASSNLSRFDGVRFGFRAGSDSASLLEMYAQTRGQGFGAEVKRRIMLGTYALSSGYYDAYYKKAQQVRTLIRRDFERVFAEVDALVTPSSPVPAFPLGARLEDPLSMYLADVYTLPASLAGLCGISVPVGFTPPSSDAPGLPIGAQVLAAPFREETLFTVAAACEATRPEVVRMPDPGLWKNG